MLAVSRRFLAMVVAAVTILVLTTGAVAAAAPRTDGSSSSAAVRLGALANPVTHRAQRVHNDLHGGGLGAPATDVAPAALGSTASATGVEVPLVAWMTLFLVSVLGALAYVARRSRLQAVTATSGSGRGPA